MESKDMAGLKDLYALKARRYLESTDHVSGPDLEAIRNLAASIFPALTVDIASGPGYALRAAAPFSGACISLDLDMEMLQVAGEQMAGAGLDGVFFLQASADNLPLADSSVSLITCRIAPHHFPSIPDFLSELRRVLDPGGRAIIIDNLAPTDQECDHFLNQTERFRDATHVHTHTLKQWHVFLLDAGFELLSSCTFERTHSFREWAPRTGMDAKRVGVLEKMFSQAPEKVRKSFRVEMDVEGSVSSYTDEKGIFILKKR
jgi:ubiquinone/menaquinone biosynthesis C-methylase UbiE